MIERMNMRSSERSEVHTFNIPCAQYIALDYEDGAFFWTDHCTYHIEHSSMNGDTRTVVAENVYFCYGLAVFEDMIYWTRVNPIAVFRMNKMGLGTSEPVLTGGSVTRYFDVVVVHPARQLSPSECYREWLFEPVWD